jgi:acyl-coenzyme A synthetase/AMP-(fatty) acid ligase
MPRSMIQRFKEEMNVNVLHIWGMTEMSPMGTLGSLLPKHKYDFIPLCVPSTTSLGWFRL